MEMGMRGWVSLELALDFRLTRYFSVCAPQADSRYANRANQKDGSVPSMPTDISYFLGGL
jgi:hypothetical protein